MGTLIVVALVAGVAAVIFGYVRSHPKTTGESELSYVESVAAGVETEATAEAKKLETEAVAEGEAVVAKAEAVAKKV